MKNDAPILLSDPLFSKDLDTIAQQHHIQALLFKKFHYYKDNKEFKRSWFNQWQYTLTLRSELKSIASKIQDHLKHEIIILKGMALTDSIYSDMGSRFMSDIDILIDQEDQGLLSKTLRDMGYTQNSHRLWSGNNFKIEWIKSFDGHEINIELHSALFYHNRRRNYETKPFSITPYMVLNIEDQIIHLAGHLVFQHTFLKLYWLFDLYFILNQKDIEIDWNKIYLKSKEDKVFRSVQMSLWVLTYYFDLNIDDNKLIKFKIKKKRLWMYFLNKKFVLSPNHSGFNYWMVKHLAKDHIFEALYYNLLWTINKIKMKVLK